MGNVLRAMNKSGQTDTAGSPAVVHVVSMAVKSAQAAAQAKLRPPAPSQPPGRQPTPAEPPAIQPVWTAPSAPATAAAQISPMVLTCHQPRNPVSEQFRQLRTSLIRLANRKAVRCLITSAQPRDGKSITSANLAYCFSELAQRRTLLIDGDLRRGRQADLFGLPADVGLGELLAGQCTAQEACRPVGRDTFHVLPAGRGDLDILGELLASAATQSAMSALVEQYDYVILDSPPVLGLADTGMLGTWVDLALLVVRIHKTPRKISDKAAATLAGAGVDLAGIVALDEQAAGHKGGYYDGYAYYGG